jgi:enterochelin esterase family protein
LVDIIDSAAALIAAVKEAEGAGRPSTGLIRDYLGRRRAAGRPSPEVAGDQVTFLYVGRRGGPATRVVFSSERDGWPEDTPLLQRVGASALYYHVEHLDPAARFLYRYVVNGRRVADRLNPHQALKERWAPKSELCMPAYHPAPQRAPLPHIPDGQLTEHILASAALGQERAIYVWTPPGYDPAAGGDYAFVLFHDGDGYIEYAGAPAILANMIAAGQIPPVVAVFAPPVDRRREYSLSDAYVAFCAEEIPALIAEIYPGVSLDPARRAVIGASLGGLISVYIAQQWPDVYGLVGSYSGATRYDDYQVERELEAAPPCAARFYLVAGLYERCLNHPHGAPGGPWDLLDNQRRLAAVLARLGTAHSAHEYPDGHNWGFWADHLPEGLAWLFGSAEC